MDAQVLIICILMAHAPLLVYCRILLTLSKLNYSVKILADAQEIMSMITLLVEIHALVHISFSIWGLTTIVVFLVQMATFFIRTDHVLIIVYSLFLWLGMQAASLFAIMSAISRSIYYYKSYMTAPELVLRPFLFLKPHSIGHAQLIVRHLMSSGMVHAQPLVLVHGLLQLRLI